MRPVALGFLACAILLGVSVPIYADVVAPNHVKATSQFGVDVIFAESLIDGSGLDDIGPVPDQLHDTQDVNMWFSGDQPAGFGSSGVDGDGDIFTVLPPQDQLLEFVLPAHYDLDSALVWQYNEEFDFFGSPASRSRRGVHEMEVLVSPTAKGDNFTSLGNVTLAPSHDPNAVGTVPPEPAQTVPLSGADKVRRVRFNILSNYDQFLGGGGNEFFVGLSEVRFDGRFVVPEASTLALFCIGFAALLPFVRSRWKRKG